MTDLAAREYAQKTIDNHMSEHSRLDPQRTLYGTRLDYTTEVKDTMKIPESAVSGGATKSGLQFVKASTLQPPANIGETVEFTIQGDVEVSHVGEGATARDLYSVPVGFARAGQKNQGQYSINKTALKILVAKLGDETTAWTGARFTGFVSPTRNPQTGGQTTTFAILADSVRTAKSR